MLSQFIYRTVRAYVRIVLRFYFRKWQIHGQENIPSNAAILFVVNHQNAFLDAMLVGCATNDEPWFITRAGVFSNSFARAVLRVFHMMPVYRFRDGWKSLRNNDVTIRQCVDILNARNSVLIFGEGDQNMRWQLRPLQKGFARIALAAQQENNWKLPLYIVPVGVQYDHHYNFRSRVLVNYGKAIAIDATYQALSDREFLDTMVAQIYNAMKPLILHIENDVYDEADQYIRKHRTQPDLVKQLQHDQAIADAWKEKPLKSEKQSIQYVKLIAALPFFLYTFINNFFGYMLTHFVITKLATVEFRGSLKLALGMVIVPLFYLIQTIVVQMVFHDWRISMAYCITLPFISVWSTDWIKAALRKNQ